MAIKINNKVIFASDVEFLGAVDLSSASETLKVDAIENLADANLPLRTGVTSLAQATVVHTAGTIVNTVGLAGAITTAGPVVSAIGTDTNIDLNLTPKGTGVVVAGTALQTAIVRRGSDANLPLQTGATSVAQATIVHTAGTIVNTVGLAGAITTAGPVVSAIGTDTNIDLNLTPKGTGVVVAGTALQTPIVRRGSDANLPLQTGATSVAQATVVHTAGTIVNTVGLAGAIATAGPIVSAIGTDDNIDLNLTPKGTGRVVVAGGVKSTPVAVVATADGLTTGLIPIDAQVITVTVASDANDIITLPAAVAGDIGYRIKAYIGATGCEVRTPAASGATINNVDSDGTNELALTANSSYIFEITAADTWVARGFTNLGADAAALVPDAA